MRPRDPREDKLPKWAQQKIDILHRDVEYLEAKLSAGPDDSNTFARRSTDASTPLGVNPQVQFFMDDDRSRRGSRVEAKLVERYGVLRLELSCPNGGLKILPYSTNVVFVMTEDY